MGASIVGGGRLQVVHLKNKSSPDNKKHHVRLGWRPEFLMGWRLLDGAGTAAFSGIKVDGSDYADGTDEAVLTNGNQDEIANVMNFADYGFIIGTGTTFFRADSAEIVMVAMASERGMLSADLGEDEIGEFSARFGSGDQFKYDEDDADDLPWLYVAP